jgi:DNA-binding transcriptional regulator YdaS (Cro superfamily)
MSNHDEDHEDAADGGAKEPEDVTPFVQLTPFERAVRIVGGMRAMANVMHCSRAQVWRLRKGEPGARLSAEQAIRIEQARTKIVRCEHLLPELPWETLRGPVIDRRGKDDLSFHRG